MLLILIWLIEGALVGLLALGARLRPPSWGLRGRLVMLAVSCGAALAGGLFGMLVLGRLQSPATALWIAVVAVVVSPLAHARLRGRARHVQD